MFTVLGFRIYTYLLGFRIILDGTYSLFKATLSLQADLSPETVDFDLHSSGL